MNAKELLSDHCIKSASHHEAVAKSHRKIAKSHAAAADAHENQTIAQAHRDASEHHEAIAKAHDSQQEHFEQMREKLAAGSGATVFDAHEDSSRELQTATHADFLRRVCGVEL